QCLVPAVVHADNVENLVIEIVPVEIAPPVHEYSGLRIQAIDQVVTPLVEGKDPCRRLLATIPHRLSRSISQTGTVDCSQRRGLRHLGMPKTSDRQQTQFWQKRK